MGAGNALIKSYDEDLYSPNTYFIDFTNYSEEQKNEIVKEHYEINELGGFEDESEKEINEVFEFIIDDWVRDFREYYFFNLPEPFNDLFSEPNEDEVYIDELSASFRGCAIVLAENDDCLVLTTDEAEIYHYPIALVPNFKYEDILEDYYQENIEKEDWYDARGKCYHSMCEDKAKNIYEKKLVKWRKEYEPLMKQFHKDYGKYLSIRSSAWTSCSIKTIGNDYKFLD